MDDFTFFAVLVAVGIALLFGVAFWIGAGAPTLDDQEPRRRITLRPSNRLDLDIPVTVEPPVLPDPLAADPFITDEQCGKCGAFQLRGSVRLTCWNCKAELTSAVVDAGPNNDEEA
jgi:hypothetical protein